VVANLARVMAEYRQNIVLTPTLDLAELLSAEEPRFAFERFDGWVETFQKAGAIGFIEGEHLVGRAGGYDEPLVVPILLREGETVRKAELPPDDPRVARFLDAFLPALNSHLEEKGWKGIYLRHVLDEPHGDEPAAYARVAALAKKHLPGVPTIDAIDAHDVSGDAFIVYPDKARLSVFASIRLEAMRAGIEDYEMLSALAKRDPAAADALAREAVASFTDYVRDPAAFRRIQAKLIEALAAR